MRRAARIDANQTEIVTALRAAGCSVYVIGKPVDLLAGRDGKSFCLEVKDEKKPPSARKLTLDQVSFFHTWRGHKAVVKNAAEALAAVGIKIRET